MLLYFYFPTNNEDIKNNIIGSASKDYDLPKHIVESIYNKYYEDGGSVFHDELEAELKRRKNK